MSILYLALLFSLFLLSFFGNGLEHERTSSTLLLASVNPDRLIISDLLSGSLPSILLFSRSLLFLRNCTCSRIHVLCVYWPLKEAEGLAFQSVYHYCRWEYTAGSFNSDLRYSYTFLAVMQLKTGPFSREALVDVVAIKYKSMRC